ncbi:MAG: efflux RND transporter permease subunit, partial [Proteobacteria bacterium]|nr:efflux RND transporter permease subunit [Pseudomonadota bacterium]
MSARIYCCLSVMAGFVIACAAGAPPKPQVMVVTHYPGASPAEVENSVTTPLEHSISPAPTVEKITSVSTEGTSTITVQLAPDADPYVFVQQFLTGQNFLPDQAERPLVHVKEPKQELLLAVAISELALAENLRDEAYRLPGVSLVDVTGGGKDELVVTLDE